MGNNVTDMICKDGLQEQIEILGELSKRLDHYFAMRHFGTDAGSDR
jgi:hypothetical protein